MKVMSLIFFVIFRLFHAKNLGTKIFNNNVRQQLKYKWDNKNVLDYAVKEAVNSAVNKTREQERAKALEEKRAIAREMKNEGLPFSQISKFTKLTIEEIEKL